MPPAIRCWCELTLPDSAQLRARIWVAQVGRVPLLLLDSDVPENEHELRSVTDRLYGGDQEHRMQARDPGRHRRGAGDPRVHRHRRAARARGVPHERGARRFPRDRTHSRADHRFGIGLRHRVDGRAVQHRVHHPHPGARRHRPVPGRDGAALLRRPRTLDGDPDEHRAAKGTPALLPGVPTARIIALGAEDDPAKFNMAHMGLRLAQRANGVSLLHGRVSRDMFNELWPGFDAARGADRVDHQRSSRAHLGGAAMVAAGPRAGRVGLVRRPRRLAATARGRPRSSVVDPLAAAVAAGRGRPAAAAPLVAGTRRVGRRIGLDSNGIRSERADHRVRPAGADLQAADADAARPGSTRTAAAQRGTGRSS